MTETQGRSWLREPLFHFLGLAALLFLANAWFAGDEREVITVDSATQDYLVEQQQDLLLRELSPEERQAIIDNFVEEEILVREARKRGFENSSRIRTLLIQNMRFFMASDIPEPTTEELRQYFEDNLDRFRTRPSITFDNVFYSDPDSVPDGVLGRLQAGEDHRGFGEAGLLQSKIIGATESQVVGSFGRENGAIILQLPDREWHGPFESNDGAHFLRVIERKPSITPTFESAQNWLSTEWLASKNREMVDEQLKPMRENYRIEIEAPGANPE